MDNKLVLHRLTMETDPNGLVPHYVALRTARYAELNVPYGPDDQSYDRHSRTEFVIATRGDKVVAGGRVLRKLPGENFSLGFQIAPFAQIFAQVLAEAGLRYEDLNVLEMGGVASEKSVNPTTFVGLKVQNALIEICEENTFVSGSRVNATNALSVALTCIQQPQNTRSLLIPNLEYLGNESCFLICTNDPRLYPVFDRLEQAGIGLAPIDFILKYKKRRNTQNPPQEPMGHSLTAAVIAIAMASISRQPQYKHLVSPEAAVFYRVASEICAQDNELLKGLRLLGPLIEGFLSEQAHKGLAMHYILRKLLIEEQTRKLVDDENIQQIVVLGAGFDSMALRLHKLYPNVAFIEIDQAALQEIKTSTLRSGARLTRRGKANANEVFLPKENLHFVAADLSQTPIDAVLAGATVFDPAKPTLFVMEGLSMYLTAAENKALLAAIERSTKGRTYILAGIAEQTQMAEVGVKSLQASGETYKWSLEAAEVPVFMAANGLRIIGAATYGQLQATLPGGNAEVRGENYYLMELSARRETRETAIANLTPNIPQRGWHLGE